MSDSVPKVMGTRSVIATWSLMAMAAFFVALPQIDQLGLYYDEAFMAQQARDFVDPGREGLHPASVRYVELLGRPFPVRNAAYLGSLKSQLLIPAFLVAGATPEVLRVTTFATAWLALLLAMLWAARLMPVRVALIMGVLVASDPSFFFLGQFEWGPFTTNLLCRSAGLLFLTFAWQSREDRTRIIAAALGGGALGLGVFSRADFAVIIAAMGLAISLGHGPLIASSLRERRKTLAAGMAGLIAASAPMWSSMISVLGSTGAIAHRGDASFRADVLVSVLDGSQFYRLMQTGGLFAAARDVDAPYGFFGFALIASGVIVGADLWAESRRDPDAARRDPRRFLWIVTAVLTLAMLALPGAVRAHHQLNTMPFWQLLVACAADVAWRRGRAKRSTVLRIAVGSALLVVVGSNLYVISETRQEIAATGGRGRWTHALNRLATELQTEPGAEAVSLDWGFHEPLLFLTEQVPLEEAIWTIPRVLAVRRPWVHDGDAATRYLIHDTPYDLFGLGPLMLATARAQPTKSVSIEPYTDALGDISFYSIRILHPHRLSYTGQFRID